MIAAEMTPADWDKCAASLREFYLTNPFNAPPLNPQDVAAFDEILPRLYSAFGGFYFIAVPVQPNQDFQESMLGFLVECTEKYDNNMAIVLLDEMNLAHVQHYFADFLSKLEMRRSTPENRGRR